MINNIIKIGSIGCLVFTGFLLFMSYSGIASKMRDENGNFQKNMNFKSILGFIMFLGFLLGLLLVANKQYLNSQSHIPSLLKLWINSLGVFFLVHIYDLIILDYLIIVKWHPKFLNLPDTPYYRTIKPHILGFVKGIPIGVIASLLASLITILTN